MDMSSGAAVTPARLPAKLIAVDIAERVFLFALFVYFMRNMLFSTMGPMNPIAMLLVVSESLPIILVCLRGPSATMSMRPSDWFLGFAAASLPLLAVPSANTEAIAPVAVSLFLVLSGILLQTAAKVFLGRSFGVIAANRGVKVSGPYRYVRHPMYAGYVMTHIAFLLTRPSLHNLLVYAAALAFQLIRIDREEQLLSRDQSYRDYAAQVRFRLIPGVY